jgi:ketosteroid isomerase-like protein
MKRISLIFIAFLMSVAGAASVSAQSNTDKIAAEIMKLEAEYTEASKNLRAEDVYRMETGDFIVTARIPPKTQTVAEIKERVNDPNYKRGTVESLTNDDVKVRVYNETTAIATGHWKRVSKSGDGKDTSAAGRFTHVWVKQNGKWLLAGAHYSPDIDLEKLRSAQTQTKKN